MDRDDGTEDQTRTTQLLSQLDHALDRSSVVRELVDEYQRLHLLESITGPSRCTRSLRREIERKESTLRSTR